MALTDSSRQPRDFHATVADHGTTRTIALAGEIDMACAAQLATTLDGDLQHGVETLVVDLADVSFIDSTGIHTLIDAYADSVRRSRRLVLLAGPPNVQRAFEISGLIDQLPFVIDAHAKQRAPRQRPAPSAASDRESRTAARSSPAAQRMLRRSQAWLAELARTSSPRH